MAMDLLDDVRLDNGAIVPASKVSEVARNSDDHGATPQQT